MSPGLPLHLHPGDGRGSDQWCKPLHRHRNGQKKEKEPATDRQFPGTDKEKKEKSCLRPSGAVHVPQNPRRREPSSFYCIRQNFYEIIFLRNSNVLKTLGLQPRGGVTLPANLLLHVSVDRPRPGSSSITTASKHTLTAGSELMFTSGAPLLQSWLNSWTQTCCSRCVYSGGLR